MTAGTRNGMIDRLRRATERAGGPALSDDELLTRFIAARDEEAFAVIVRRHGPLVLAVCRRVSANVEVADDAFQAVFMVLAKKADSVRPREAVRGWLYGVATRTALRARTMTGRWEKRETLVGTVPDQPASTHPDTDPDALRILNEEIGRLPETLRAAVVLCELDGVGRKEAATRLRVPEGTLSSRLAKRESSSPYDCAAAVLPASQLASQRWLARQPYPLNLRTGRPARRLDPKRRLPRRPSFHARFCEPCS